MIKSNVKGVRLIVAGIALFFVFFVIIRIFFDESKKFTPPLINNATMFFALWAIIILFSLTFLFILIRNLIKLYYEKKGYEGGRFKNRLVFFFIAFSIIPTLLIFFFARDLITHGIDKWFKPNIESIMTKFADLDASYYEKAKDDLRHFAKLMANDIQYYKKYSQANRHYLHN